MVTVCRHRISQRAIAGHRYTPITQNPWWHQFQESARKPKRGSYKKVIQGVWSITRMYRAPGIINCHVRSARNSMAAEPRHAGCRHHPTTQPSKTQVAVSAIGRDASNGSAMTPPCTTTPSGLRVLLMCDDRVQHCLQGMQRGSDGGTSVSTPQHMQSSKPHHRRYSKADDADNSAEPACPPSAPN
jgi:hypothetical protein